MAGHKPMRDHLTPRQHVVVRMLAEGATVQEAADRAGTVGTRIQKWLTHDLFKAELAKAQEAFKTLHDKVREKLEATMIPAADRLKDSIELDQASPSQVDSSKFVLAATGHGPIAKTVQITATVNVTDDLLARLEQVIREAESVAQRAGRMLPPSADA